MRLRVPLNPADPVMTLREFGQDLLADMRDGVTPRKIIDTLRRLPFGEALAIMAYMAVDCTAAERAALAMMLDADVAGPTPTPQGTETT